MQPETARQTLKALADEAASYRDNWTPQAACLSYGPHLWYSPKETDITTAKAICFQCPVQGKCLELALLTRERDGVWGGLDEKQRSRLMRQLLGRTAGFDSIVFVAKMRKALSDIVSRNILVQQAQSG